VGSPSSPSSYLKRTSLGMTGPGGAGLFSFSGHPTSGGEFCNLSIASRFGPATRGCQGFKNLHPLGSIPSQKPHEERCSCDGLKEACPRLPRKSLKTCHCPASNWTYSSRLAIARMIIAFSRSNRRSGALARRRLGFRPDFSHRPRGWRLGLAVAGHRVQRSGRRAEDFAAARRAGRFQRRSAR
jgi:hypothetical protein